jgi:mono/diheme cytochrome c family protein
MKIQFSAAVISLALVAMPAISKAQLTDDELLARGTYLMEGIVACGNCHTPKTPDAVPREELKFAGGFVIQEPGFRGYAPNITPDEETGIGTWTDEEIIVAIRDGLRPDGTILGPPMPSPFYRGMSDTDARSLVAYLRNLEPIRNIVPKSEYNIPLPPNYGPPIGTVPDVPRDDPLTYGKYLAESLGHCMECHTHMVEGRHDFENGFGMGGNPYTNPFELELTTVSSNITSHSSNGLGAWSDADIKKAITEGIRPDGRTLEPFMGFQYYKNISDEDVTALIAYLRSLPPLPAE